MLARIGAGGEQALRRLLVPGGVAADRREAAPHARDDAGRHSAHRRLRERRLRRGDVRRARGPDERRGEVGAALGLVAAEALGERLERARERARLLAVAEQIELERPRRDALGIGGEGVAERSERAAAIAAQGRGLGDAQPERRGAGAGEAPIELALRDLGRPLGVARRLERAEPRARDHRRLREPLGRALEERARRVGVAGALLQLGGAEPEVGGVLGVPHVAGDAHRVAERRIVERLGDHLGLALERAREDLDVVLLGRDRLEGEPGPEARAPLERHGGVEQLVGARRLPRLGRELGEIDVEQRLPGGIGGELAARLERAHPRRRVALLGGEHLELEPGERVLVVGADGLLERVLGTGEVVLVVLEVGGVLGEGARPLLRRDRGARERVEELAEVLDRLAPREDADQRLERLAELRIEVERGEVVARGDRLLAVVLLEHAALVQEQRLLAFVLLRRLLGAQARDQGLHRVVRLSPGRLDGHRLATSPESGQSGRSRRRTVCMTGAEYRTPAKGVQRGQAHDHPVPPVRCEPARSPGPVNRSACRASR